VNVLRLKFVAIAPHDLVLNTCASFCLYLGPRCYETRSARAAQLPAHARKHTGYSIEFCSSGTGERWTVMPKWQALLQHAYKTTCYAAAHRPHMSVHGQHVWSTTRRTRMGLGGKRRIHIHQRETTLTALGARVAMHARLSSMGPGCWKQRVDHKSTHAFDTAISRRQPQPRRAGATRGKTYRQTTGHVTMMQS